MSWSVTLLLGGIFEGPLKLASALFHFLWSNADTVFLVTWFGGAATVIIRQMMRWHREDADEARHLCKRGDQAEMYELMRQVSKLKKDVRRKWLFVHGVCWIFLGLWGIGKFIAHPVLLLLHRSQAQAVDDVIALNELERRKKKVSTVQCPSCACFLEVDETGKVSLVEVSHPAVERPRFLTPTVGAGPVTVPTKAMCNRCREEVVAEEVHECYRKKTPKCTICKRELELEVIHRCEPEDGPEEDSEGSEEVHDCPKCGDEVFLEEVHECSGRVEYCDECESALHEGNHKPVLCGDCGDSHCPQASC